MVEKLTLTKPIEFGDEDVISELELQAPDLGGLERLDKVKGEVAQLITLISVCSGLDPVRVKKISAEDLEAIKGVLGKLMPGLLTGGI